MIGAFAARRVMSLMSGPTVVASVFVVICAIVVIGYIAYVARGFKRGTLNPWGRPAVAPDAGIGEMLGGCVSAIGVLVAMLAALFGLIWIIKRMWEAA